MLIQNAVRSPILPISAACFCRFTGQQQLRRPNFQRSRQFSTSFQLKDRYFTKKHEWIEVEAKRDAVGTVGITDFAQKSLGDVVFVELPEVSSQLKAGETAGAIESVKAASDLYAPVSGEVMERNEKVEQEPALVNKSCFGKGWLYKLKVADPAELSNLMGEKDYELFAALEENKEDETQKF